jgi:hypothetical protein
MYLSISSWSDPALATFARLGVVALGDTVGLDETVVLLSPQPTAIDATKAVTTTAHLDRYTCTSLTSIVAIGDSHHLTVHKSSIGVAGDRPSDGYKAA